MTASPTPARQASPDQMTLAIFYYLWRTLHGMTGLGLEDILRVDERQDEA